MERGWGGRAVRMVGALLACAAIVGTMSVAGRATATTAGFRAVRDPANRFTIDVPATWQVRTQVKNPSVTAKSPGQTSALPDSLDVIVYDMVSPIVPQECVQESDLVLRFAIHNWTTVSQGPVTIAGRPGYTRTYDWKTNAGSPRRSVQTCVTVGPRAFMVVGTTQDTSVKIASALPVLQRAISTLRPNVALVPATRVASQAGNR